MSRGQHSHATGPILTRPSIITTCSFEVQVLDDKNVRRRFRASNYQVRMCTDTPACPASLALSRPNSPFLRFIYNYPNVVYASLTLPSCSCFLTD